MSCERHPTKIKGFDDMESASRAVADLHYKSLAQFLGWLSVHIKDDSRKDEENGRVQLAAKLNLLSNQLIGANDTAKDVWEICKPYMEDPL